MRRPAGSTRALALAAVGTTVRTRLRTAAHTAIRTAARAVLRKEAPSRTRVHLRAEAPSRTRTRARTEAPRRTAAVGVAALLAALVVALLPAPAPTTAPARAVTPAAVRAPAAGDSAVTVTGTKGKYDDFSSLKVTVHQTTQLRAQGVRVSWTGGRPTETGFAHNYLQLMQCWGEDRDGPRRDQCQFGGSGVRQSGSWTSLRQIDAVPDPAETEYIGNGNDESYVPFRPANGEQPTTGSRDWTYFGSLDTNEEPYAVTHSDGTGEFTFPMLTDQEADQLGCGAPVAEGASVRGRSCWLVIVPRGEHDVDGATGAGNPLQSSPLAASNWAQRMAVRLDFLPVGNSCPADRAERRVIGSELVTDAISSWQPAVCSAEGGAKFAFSQSGEESARDTISRPVAGAPGLAFTVDPVAAEENAGDAGEGGSGSVVHAPVAVSGLAVGFFVELPGSGQLASMRITPRLLAKLLTSSYQKDVTRGRREIPEHIKDNPLSLFHDPEFKELNPEFEDWKPTSLPPMSLMVQLANSDTTRMAWQWLRSDREAREFLSGAADPWGTKMNPYFADLALATETSVSDFPKADPTRTTVTIGEDTLEYGTTEVAPYVQDMHDGALRTRRGNNGATTTADASSNGSPAKLINTPPLPGQRMVLALVDAASAARYGLQTAALRNADGTFVTPTADSLLAGVAAMRNSPVPGVLATDPGAAEGDAYPLASVVYAAGFTGTPAAERKDYAALVRYAAGPGQSPGVSPGQLPPGYAPLPAAMRTQALAAADRLQNAKAGEAGGDPSGGAGGGGADGAGSAAGGAFTGGAGSGGGAPGSGGSTGGTDPAAEGGAAGPSASATAPAPARSVAAPAGLTPSTVLGIIRWVLLGVLLAGGLAAISGPVLLRLSARKSAGAG
ncbi:hypothetical protein OG875_21135 [Streptomyces sp. NBC_01498]|uniref:hypothetical protein n=1 Tax=Streptomyces sp. NBC_01498 TaxID=2975870 RepID=UPI002E7B8B16|nr:hypothetical protein [Streptomyces sp. NBC_01498]WTL26849.1 hypothetical protein OG875_21135 [Streptomyces sp. NBC_01498]